MQQTFITKFYISIFFLVIGIFETLLSNQVQNGRSVLCKVFDTAVVFFFTGNTVKFESLYKLIVW